MMYTNHLLNSDDDVHLENQIYDLLSNFLKTFRKSIALAECLASLVQQEQQYTHIINKIQVIFEECRPLLQKYQKAQGHKIIQPMTFNRFACRLLEITYLYSTKYKENGLSPPFISFLHCLRELESTIRKYQQSRMLSDIIKVSQLSFVKFCLSCKKTSKGGVPQDQETFKKLKDTVKRQQSRPKESQNHNNQTKSKNKKIGQLSDSQSDQEEREPFMIANIAKTSSLPTYNKELMALQKRFDTFKGLDLDFSMFRADYFSAKNSQDQFFRDFLRRNEPNRRIITQYQDDFYLFQKKKNNRESRKKKMNTIYNKTKTLGHSSIQRLNSIEQSLQQNLFPHQQRSERIIPQPLILQNVFIQSQSQADVMKLADQSSKQQLTMSKIQIAWGKECNQPKSTLKNFKTLTKAQPICINQYYYNSMDNRNKNTVNLINNRLKVDSTHSKTEARHTPSIQMNKSAITDLDMSSPNNPIKVAIKSRSVFKGKYLEVNCIRDPFRRAAVDGSLSKGSFKKVNRSENKRRIIFNLG